LKAKKTYKKAANEGHTPFAPMGTTSPNENMLTMKWLKIHETALRECQLFCMVWPLAEI
jgi:hypothetical protein